MRSARESVLLAVNFGSKKKNCTTTSKDSQVHVNPTQIFTFIKAAKRTPKCTHHSGKLHFYMSKKKKAPAGQSTTQHTHYIILRVHSMHFEAFLAEATRENTLPKAPTALT